MTLYEKVLEEVSKQESNTEDWDGLSEEQQFIFVSLIKEKMDVLNADQVNDLFISFLRKGTLEEEDFSSLVSKWFEALRLIWIYENERLRRGYSTSQEASSKEI